MKHFLKVFLLSCALFSVLSHQQSYADCEWNCEAAKELGHAPTVSERWSCAKSNANLCNKNTKFCQCKLWWVGNGLSLDKMGKMDPTKLDPKDPNLCALCGHAANGHNCQAPAGSDLY